MNYKYPQVFESLSSWKFISHLLIFDIVLVSKLSTVKIALKKDNHIQNSRQWLINHSS